MRKIESQPLPERALLNRYSGADTYADCFVAEVAGAVDLVRYVEAFYTTPLFKLERLILKLAVAKPSTDVQARQVAAGAIEAFAAWRAEARSADQLVMGDVYGNTRSWFMVEPVVDSEPARTRLYFGTGVSAAAMSRSSFRTLLSFHVWYSKALLRAACRRIGSVEAA